MRQQLTYLSLFLLMCAIAPTCQATKAFYMNLEAGVYRHYSKVLRDSKTVAASLEKSPIQRMLVQRFFNELSNVPFAVFEKEKKAALGKIIAAFLTILDGDQKAAFLAALPKCQFRPWVRDVFETVLSVPIALTRADVAVPDYVEINWIDDATCPYSSYVLGGRFVAAVRESKKMRVALQPLLTILSLVRRTTLLGGNAGHIGKELQAAVTEKKCTTPDFIAASFIAREQKGVAVRIVNAFDLAWDSSWGALPWEKRVVVPPGEHDRQFSYSFATKEGNYPHFFFRCRKDQIYGLVQRRQRGLLQTFFDGCLAKITVKNTSPPVSVLQPLFLRSFKEFEKALGATQQAQLWECILVLPFCDWLKEVVREHWKEKPFVAPLIEAARYWSFMWVDNACEGTSFFVTPLYFSTFQTAKGKSDLEPVLSIARRIPREDLRLHNGAVCSALIQGMISDGTLTIKTMTAVGALVCSEVSAHRFQPWFREVINSCWPREWGERLWTKKVTITDKHMCIKPDGTVAGVSRLFNAKVEREDRTAFVSAHRESVERVLLLMNHCHGVSRADKRQTKALFLAEAKEKIGEGVISPEDVLTVAAFVKAHKLQFWPWFRDAMQALKKYVQNRKTGVPAAPEPEAEATSVPSGPSDDAPSSLPARKKRHVLAVVPPAQRQPLPKPNLIEAIMAQRDRFERQRSDDIRARGLGRPSITARSSVPASLAPPQSLPAPPVRHQPAADAVAPTPPVFTPGDNLDDLFDFEGMSRLSPLPFDERLDFDDNPLFT